MELEYKELGNYESEEKAIMFRILRFAYKPLGLPCFYRRVQKYHVKSNNKGNAIDSILPFNN